MEDFILELLNLVHVAEVFRVSLHLTRWLRVLVDKLVLEFLLISLESKNSLVDVMHLLLGKQNLPIALFDLRLESFQVALVLLLNLPVLELATWCVSRDSIGSALTDTGSDLCARLGSRVQVCWQGLATLGLSDLGTERCDFKLSRTRFICSAARLCGVEFEHLLDFSISERYSKLLHGSLKLSLVKFTSSLAVILSELGPQVESLVTN